MEKVKLTYMFNEVILTVGLLLNIANMSAPGKGESTQHKKDSFNSNICDCLGLECCLAIIICCDFHLQLAGGTQKELMKNSFRLYTLTSHELNPA